jgi:hypothetical protein
MAVEVEATGIEIAFWGAGVYARDFGEAICGDAAVGREAEFVLVD